MLHKKVWEQMEAAGMTPLRKVSQAEYPALHPRQARTGGHSSSCSWLIPKASPMGWFMLMRALGLETQLAISWSSLFAVSDAYCPQ